MSHKKCYFVHIPKTAGNSVRSVLRDRNLLTNPGYKKYQREHHFASRNAQRVVGSHLSFKTPIFPSFLDDPLYHDANFSFTIVRNPFDMLVSYYIHHIENHKKNWADHGWANVNGHHGFSSFDEFVRFYAECSPGEWHVPSLNQNLFGQIFDDDSELSVDYVIYYEKMQEGLSELLVLLTGRNETISLPRKNISLQRENRKYQDFYDNELKGLISKKCEWELKSFKYDFETYSGVSIAKIEELI